MRRAHACLALVLGLCGGLLGAGLLGGCDSLAARRPPGSRLEPAIFQDVPAPVGARYVNDHSESFSYRGGTFRSGRFEFLYDGEAEGVADFYRQTMISPPYDWILDHEDRRESGSTFVFTKNQDRCTVDVDQLPATTVKPRKEVRILVRVNFRKE